MMSALGDINEALKRSRVKFRLPKVGGGKGEWLITKLFGTEKITDFLTVLRFGGISPWVKSSSPEVVQEHIMLDSKDTCVVIPIINDKYVVLTQQHRPILGQWLREIPRGWYQAEGGWGEILRRKIPRLLGDTRKNIPGICQLVEHVELLGPIFEDSGLRTNKTRYFIVRTVCETPSGTDEEIVLFLRKLLQDYPDGYILKPRVYTISELDNKLSEFMITQDTANNDGLIDAISISIWAAFFFYRQKIRKPLS